MAVAFPIQQVGAPVAVIPERAEVDESGELLGVVAGAIIATSTGTMPEIAQIDDRCSKEAPTT